MANWAGGIMTALGGAAAGGFKAAGEVADDSMKNRAEALKLEAIGIRQESLERIRNQFAINRDIENQKFETGLAEVKMKHSEKLAKDEFEFRGKDTEAKVKGDLEVAKLRAASDKYHVDKSTAAQIQAANISAGKRGVYEHVKTFVDNDGNVTAIGVDRAGKGQIIDLEGGGEGISKKTASKSDPNAVKYLQMANEALKELVLPGSTMSLEYVNSLFAKAGEPPLKEVVTKGKTHFFGKNEPDTKRYVPDMQGLAAPTGNDGEQRTEPGASTGKPRTRTAADMLRLLGEKPQGNPATQTQRQPEPMSKQGQTAELPKLSMTELDSILNQSTESQAGPYKTSYKPGETRSIGSWVQGLAGSTQPDSDKKFGEGELEFAIRQAKAINDLPTLKDMAENLRKQFPKVSDAELAKMVLSATEESEAM